MTITNKLFSTSAAAALVLSAIVPVASATEFQDADQIPAWAQDAVEVLVSENILQGSDGKFNPTGIVTRAQAAEILYKALELPVEGTEDFSDVEEGAWYYKAVVATSPEIFEGDENGKFNPSGKLTREQAAAVMVRAFGLTGEADLSSYPDASQVSGWAKEAMAIAVENGVIKGQGENLAPKADVSRAEIAVMVHRVLQEPELPELAPIMERVTLESADKMVIEFKEAIHSEVDVNKVTVAGYEVDENNIYTAKDLTGEDLVASVVENKLTLTAKAGVKFATGAEGNGEEGNLISFDEQAVVSKGSAISIEATDVAEGTVVDGKLAGVTFIDNAAPAILFGKEVSNEVLSFTFTETIEVEGNVAPQFSIDRDELESLVGETAEESGNTLAVTFADAWKDGNATVTVQYATDETSYIADAFDNKVAATDVTNIEFIPEEKNSELDLAVETAGTAVTALTTKVGELSEKIDGKKLSSDEASDIFTLAKSAQEAVNTVAALDENHEQLANWNEVINNVPFVAVGTFINENEATIAFTKPIQEAVTTTDIKNALKPITVGEVVKNTADYYFSVQNGTVTLKKTSSADETRWGTGLVEGTVEITIDQSTIFGQQLTQSTIRF